MSLISIIMSIIGWIVGRLAGKRKEKKAEEKYARARKENLEIRAENTGLRVRKNIADAEAKVQEKWDEAQEKGGYGIKV